MTVDGQWLGLLISGALDRLAIPMSHADRQSLVETVEPLVLSNVTRGDRRLTWKEVFEREHAENVELRKAGLLVADLDRCEHGRHEGDDCAGCGGPSLGNPLWDGLDNAEARLRMRFRGTPGGWPERLIGFGLDGVPICVPPRPEPGGAPRKIDDYYRRDLR